MAWDIKVWHNDQGDRVKLTVEASAQVPEEVIASVAGTYWRDEVQYIQGDWDESALDAQVGQPGNRMHG